MPPFRTILLVTGLRGALLLWSGLAAVPFAYEASAQEPVPRAAVPFAYEAGFSMQVPAGWEIVRDVGIARAIVVSPLSGPDDAFRENVNVVIDGLLAVMSRGEYERLNLTLMQQELTDFEVVDTAELELAGYPTTRMRYEHRADEHRLRSLSYTVMAGNRAFVLTGTAARGAFTEFEPVFEEVMRSFRPHRAGGRTRFDE